jgi:mannose-6-phosphate isomerase-like protein (cupin superfamily)
MSDPEVQYGGAVDSHEDERRILTSIFNGDFVGKQAKVLEIKKASTLGNHYHLFRELFFVLKGGGTYTFESVESGLQHVISVKPGDRLIIAPKVAHKGELKAGTIMIEATEEVFTPETIIKYEVE